MYPLVTLMLVAIPNVLVGTQLRECTWAVRGILLMYPAPNLDVTLALVTNGLRGKVLVHANPQACTCGLYFEYASGGLTNVGMPTYSAL